MKNAPKESLPGHFNVKICLLKQAFNFLHIFRMVAKIRTSLGISFPVYYNIVGPQRSAILSQ